jgi:hypothetical protein
LRKGTFQHHQIATGSLAIDSLAFFCQYSTGAKLAKQLVICTGGKGALELLGGCTLAVARRKPRAARRWQEVLPNLRSISHAHQ